MLFSLIVFMTLPRSFDWFFGDLSYSRDIDNLRNLDRQLCNPVSCAFCLTPVQRVFNFNYWILGQRNYS